MSNFSVIIVHPEFNRLEDRSWKAVVDDVSAELSTLVRKAKSKAVRGGFSVVQKTKLTESEIGKLKPTDFVVYCLRKSNLDRFKAKTEAHLGLKEREIRSLAAKAKTHLDADHGMTVRHNGRVVGFVPVNQYERIGRGPMVGGDDEAAMEVHAGREMAQLVLHELGHMMGVSKHTRTGLMQANDNVAQSPDFFEESHFTASSRKIILKRLRKLAR